MRIARRMLPNPKAWGMQRPTPAPNRLERYLHSEPFATADQVLLCCFGLDRETSARSPAQLRAALMEAGFRATVARHLIRTSSILRRDANGRYRLRESDVSSTLDCHSPRAWASSSRTPDPAVETQTATPRPDPAGPG